MRLSTSDRDTVAETAVCSLAMLSIACLTSRRLPLPALFRFAKGTVVGEAAADWHVQTLHWKSNRANVLIQEHPQQRMLGNAASHLTQVCACGDTLSVCAAQGLATCWCAQTGYPEAHRCVSAARDRHQRMCAQPLGVQGGGAASAAYAGMHALPYNCRRGHSHRCATLMRVLLSRIFAVAF